MATNDDNKEVKEFVERVSIEGRGGNDEESDEEETETSTESSQSETGDDEESEESEGESETKETDDETEEDDEEAESAGTTIEKKPAGTTTETDLTRQAGETDREYALRQEVTRLKRLQKKERAGELIQRPAQGKAKKELAPERKKVLEKYKPEDIQNLREVFDVLAEDMGFVKADELGAKTYTEKAAGELDSFLEGHPEYLPENDPDNLMWGKFKAEYALYKQPEDPKDFKKIFEKVHRDIFGVKPAGGTTKIAAQKEKVKVASHSGASKPAPRKNSVTRSTTNVRLDMLKGFSEDEIADIESRQGGE